MFYLYIKKINLKIKIKRVSDGAKSINMFLRFEILKIKNKFTSLLL